MLSDGSEVSSNRTFGMVSLGYALISNAVDSICAGHAMPIPDGLINLIMLFVGGGALGKAADVGKAWAGGPETTQPNGEPQ
jgi:hypothetical protein